MKTINKIYKMNKKTRIMMLLIASIPFITFSQSVFEKYEDLDEVSTVVVTKSAFRLMGKIGSDSEEAKQYIHDVQSLDNLAVYSTSDSHVAANMKADVKKYLNSEKLSELFRVKDKNGNVKIYVREGEDSEHVKELFMFIENIDKVKIDGETMKAVIVTLIGDIDLNRVGKIIDKMNIPGGYHINEATHK